MNARHNFWIAIVTMLYRLFTTAAAGRATVKHTVMFSFKDGVSKGEINKIKNGLLDLPKKIPCIKSYELGCDLKLEAGQNHPAGKNKMIVWSACFDSVEDYQKYDKHEAHVAFLRQLKNVVLPGSRSAIQYEGKDFKQS